MDYYDFSCEVDRIQSKVDCFAEMMATLASAESDNQPSGTYWFIHDTLKSYSKELEVLSNKTMEQHQISLQPKKGKKK